jgi:glycosyltransferase involved in cell wall biosynthesis
MIDVIPPFLADGAFALEQGDRPSFVPPEGPYVMFAGALGSHKGIDVLLDAWGGVDLDVPLVVVGLRRHDSPTHFPKGVIVVEDIPHKQVLQAWRHCAVAVVPSRWPEPIGLVALEAMAAGCPIVASSVGGLAELVEDGRTGTLVPPGDPMALRIAIAGMLADPDQRRRMGAAAIQKAQRYSAGTVVSELEDVYREVLRSPLSKNRGAGRRVNKTETALGAGPAYGD